MGLSVGIPSLNECNRSAVDTHVPLPPPHSPALPSQCGVTMEWNRAAVLHYPLQQKTCNESSLEYSQAIGSSLRKGLEWTYILFQKRLWEASFSFGKGSCGLLSPFGRVRGNFISLSEESLGGIFLDQ